MWLSMRVGLRNLRRNLRRSILTGLMLFVGTALVVWIVGLNEGGYRMLIQGLTQGFTGHFQILHSDYNEEPTLYKSVPKPKEIIQRLEGLAGVKGVAPRLESGGLLAAENRTTMVTVFGVDPSRESRLTSLPNAVKRGQWLPTEERSPEALPPIIIGKGVAQRLQVDLGDEVSFIGQAADGSMAADLFEVVGIYVSGASELDSAITLMNLRDAQELFVLGERVHRLVGLLQPSAALPEVMGEIEVDPPLQAQRWDQVEEALAQRIQDDRQESRVILFIVLLIVVLGVANTMLMSVFERTKEFGIMLALGTPQKTVLAFTLWEVVWLSLMGIGLGTLVGAVMNMVIVIPLEEGIEFAGFVWNEMRGNNSAESTFVFPFIIFLGSVISGLVPARRASKLDPLEAIHSV